MDYDILDEIRRYLGEEDTEPPAVTTVESPPATEPEKRPPSRPPKVGTTIQRSDAANRRKIAMLATPPPPLAQVRRRVPTPVLRPPRSTVTEPVITPRPPTPPKTPAPPSTVTVDAPESEREDPATTPRDPRPVRPSPGEIMRPTGPRELPPIWVELEPGYAYPVPYHAVHVSRRFRPRTPRGRWSLRFDRQGNLRSRNKIQEKPQNSGFRGGEAM